jgi:hypothetical protein
MSVVLLLSVIKQNVIRLSVVAPTRAHFLSSLSTHFSCFLKMIGADKLEHLIGFSDKKVMVVFLLAASTL